MESFIHGHIDTGFGQISGAGKSCRTGSDNGRLFTRRLKIGSLIPTAPDGEVGNKSFQTPDCNRVHLASDNAGRFALYLLGTDTAADRRQSVGVLENFVRLPQVFE